MILYVVKVLKAHQSLILQIFLIFLNKIFFVVFYMMSESPGPKDGDETCPVCNKTKDKHMSEEMLACSRKMEESQKHESDKSQ